MYSIENTCSPTCQNNGVCDETNNCDCSGTGYDGIDCSCKLLYYINLLQYTIIMKYN